MNHRLGTVNGRFVWAPVGLAIALVASVFVALGCLEDLGEARDLDAQGNLGGAVEAYARVLERDPENLEALASAAVDLVLLQRYDEALVLQERIVALDPTDAQTRVELGFNYLNHQDLPREAVRVLCEAANLEPTAQRLSFLAQAEKASGDIEGAESTLHRALEVDPSYPYSYALLVALLEETGRSEEIGALQEYATAQGISIDATP